MVPIQLTEEEYQRLIVAKDLKKYGHLKTWKELFIYEYTLASPVQLQEIATYARKKRLGEKITLPLKEYGKQEELLKEKTDTT